MDSNLKFRSLTLPDVFIDQDTPEKMYEIAGWIINQLRKKFWIYLIQILFCKNKISLINYIELYSSYNDLIKHMKA